MKIAEPIWIIIGFFVCVGCYSLLRLMEKRRTGELQKFAAKNLVTGLTQNVSQRKRMLKRVLLLAALFACFIALARPQYGHRWIDVKRKGIDILFAIDTSTSMLAEDIQPNRLQRSKYAILDFVSQLEGDRVGLLPFAGSSYLMCPLTVDYGAFEQSLLSVNTDIIPTPGTNIAQAIATAENILQNDANHKLLIIITDGENLDGDVEQAAERAAAQKMTIFTVGVGTAKGELIPFTKNGRQGFIKNESGAFVTSRLDEKGLRSIADLTGGLYAPLGNRGQGLETIYQQKLSMIPKEELAERRQKVPVERFTWPLGAALLMLISEFLLSSRKRTAKPFRLPSNFRVKICLVFLLMGSLSLFQPVSSSASPGEEAYENEDFITASQYYQEKLEKDPENATLQYNHGTAAYKNNLYDEAVASFTKALHSDNLDLQQKAYYNIGNARFRQGEETLQANPDKTVTAWQNALESYQASLQLNPDDVKAQTNHDLVQKKLEELKKQQEQQSQKQQDQEKEKQDQEQSGNNKDSESSAGEEGREQTDPGAEEQPQNAETEERQEEKNADTNSLQPDDERQEQPAEGQTERQGELTREEAQLLLDELKNEEGALNFIPKKQNKNESNTRRNW